MASVGKKAIDLMYSVLGFILGHTDAKPYRDGFIDGTLKMVRFFGVAATYVIAPDGSTHTTMHAAANLSQARLGAWSFHQATLLSWLETADESALIAELNRESSIPGHNASLVNSIRKELDRRSSSLLYAVG